MSKHIQLPESGVHAAPDDTSKLRAVFVRPGDAWRTVDLTAARDKADLLRAFARALDLPPHFGHNWDALADSLQDLSWLRWSRLAIEIAGSDALRRDSPREWSVALDILRDAATYWAAHGRTMLVLVRGATDLPQRGA